MTTTHPTFDREYDCPKGRRIEGEMRYHGKGADDDCPTCERYRATFG